MCPSRGRWTRTRIGSPTVWSGTTDDAAALEITLVGPELRVQRRGSLRGLGRAFELSVDGRPVDRGISRSDVASGATLRFGRRLAGARATLAIRGGIDVPPVLGSRATSLVSAMGPFGGRALVAGDVAADRTGHRRRSRSRAAASAAASARRRSARCASSPARTSSASPPTRSSDLFFRGRFTVTTQSNRMGYRLDGPALSHGPRRGHPLRRHADRVAAGAEVRAADPADGRSADDRRISEDCDGDRGRPAARRPARAGRLDPLRAVHARGRARRAAAARAASGRAGAHDRVRRRAAAPRSATRVAASVRRSRRSRPSRSAARPTCSVDASTGPSELQRAVDTRAGARRAGHGPRRRLEPSHRRRGSQRAGRCGCAAARSSEVAAGRDSRGCGRHHQRTRALDDYARARRPRSVGRHAGHGGRRHLRQRALPGAQHQRVVVQASACWIATASVHDVPAAGMEFAYDYSRLQRTGEIVLSRPISGSAAASPSSLRAVARESLAYRKRTQPLALPSAGCIFQNPDPDARSRAGRTFRGRPARWSIAPD